MARPGLCRERLQIIKQVATSNVVFLFSKVNTASSCI